MKCICSNEDKNDSVSDSEAELLLVNENKFKIKDVLHILITYFAYFAFFADFTIPASFFTVEALAKGVDETEIGLIFGSYAFISFVGSPFIGKLLLLAGEKSCYLSSTFLAAVSTFIFSFVLMIHNVKYFVSTCTFLRLVAGGGHLIFKGVAFNTWTTLYPAYSSTLVGIGSVAFGVGVASGPVIGGLLYDTWGFPLPFIVMSIIFAVCFILFIFSVSAERADISNNVNQDSSFYDIYFKADMYIPFMALSCICMNDSFLSISVAAQMKKMFQKSASFTGLMFAGFQVPYSIVAPLVGILSDKFNKVESFILCGLIFEVFAFVVIGPAPFINIKGKYETSDDILTTAKITAFFLTSQATGSSRMQFCREDPMISDLDKVYQPDPMLGCFDRGHRDEPDPMLGSFDWGHLDEPDPLLSIFDQDDLDEADPLSIFDRYLVDEPDPTLGDFEQSDHIHSADGWISINSFQNLNDDESHIDFGNVRVHFLQNEASLLSPDLNHKPSDDDNVKQNQNMDTKNPTSNFNHKLSDGDDDDDVDDDDDDVDDDGDEQDQNMEEKYPSSILDFNLKPSVVDNDEQDQNKKAKYPTSTFVCRPECLSNPEFNAAKRLRIGVPDFDGCLSHIARKHGTDKCQKLPGDSSFLTHTSQAEKRKRKDFNHKSSVDDEGNDDNNNNYDEQDQNKKPKYPTSNDLPKFNSNFKIPRKTRPDNLPKLDNNFKIPRKTHPDNLPKLDSNFKIPRKTHPESNESSKNLSKEQEREQKLKELIEKSRIRYRNSKSPVLVPAEAIKKKKRTACEDEIQIKSKSNSPVEKGTPIAVDQTYIEHSYCLLDSSNKDKSFSHSDPQSWEIENLTSSELSVSNSPQQIETSIVSDITELNSLHTDIIIQSSYNLHTDTSAVLKPKILEPKILEPKIQEPKILKEESLVTSQKIKLQSNQRERESSVVSKHTRYERHPKIHPDQHRRTTIFVGNIEEDSSEESIRCKFHQYGHIVQVNIKKRFNKNMEHYCFVQFACIEDADDVIANHPKNPILSEYRINYGQRRQFLNQIPYRDLERFELKDPRMSINPMSPLISQCSFQVAVKVGKVRHQPVIFNWNQQQIKFSSVPDMP
ncbi:MFS-type transporter SLC18B1 [Nymphon striatum]|nr:MFS-type transporter SLC18B1 [Nymphon striatum]